MNKNTPTNANKPQVVFLIVRRNILLVSKANSIYPDNLKENEKVCKRNYSKHRSKCRYAQDFFCVLQNTLRTTVHIFNVMKFQTSLLRAKPVSYTHLRAHET